MIAPRFTVVSDENSGHLPTQRPLAHNGGDTHSPDMENERLARLEGAYDSLKVVRPMTLTVVSIFLAALVFVLGIVITQQLELSKKVDAIGPRITEEAARTRQEMVGITNAIANSITATRQAQPPAPPQVVIIPPGTTPQPTPPKPSGG